MGAGTGAQRFGVFAKPDPADKVKRRKVREGGHKQADRFVMIPRAFLVDPQWNHLPAAARVIFIDMCKLHRHGSDHRPSNNGQIGYGCTAGAKVAKASVATAWRMLEELRSSGLLKLRTKGEFKVKAGEGRATEWEITIYPIAGRPPIARGDGRLHIPHRLLEAAAYKGLSNQAKCILVEMMRRYDGGNNAHISFGGQSGAHAGFSADVTERALTKLQGAGFAIQTAPAVPYLRRPRQWRLTMYASDNKPATKEFLRDPKPGTREKLDHDFAGAGESPMNVSVMRPSFSTNLPVSPTETSLVEKISGFAEGLREGGPNLDNRAGEAFDAADARTSEIHLEASPRTSSEASLPAPSTLLSRHVPIVPVGPATAAKMSVRTKPSAETSIEPAARLFGDVLPSIPTPLDRLRLELRGVLARKRGTQSRLAEALGLSSSTFANALSGRARFTATAVAALRRWLDGEPISEEWPPLPSGTEEPNAA